MQTLILLGFFKSHNYTPTNRSDKDFHMLSASP
nr:MAG TPA: hypothetical protein [Caudoviricetes sp.]